MIINVPEPISELLKKFGAAGFEACLVGGCVRDSLRGVRPEDYDVATAALPEQTEELFRDSRVIETGMKHGTVTVIAGNFPVEITTYRTENGYSDHRHPDAVAYTSSLREDLSRRDFTVNAMAYMPKKGIIDPFGGTEDLKNGVLRCVGEPERRFDEDALRILRAVRFSSTLGFSVEEHTAAAASKKRDMLRFVSNERISAEFSKLICGDFAVKAITDFGDIIREFIPIPESGGLSAVFALSSLDKNIPLRLAALLAHLSSEQAEAHLRRLRYSNAVIGHTVKLITALKDGVPADYADICAALDRLTPELFFELIQLVKAIAAADGNTDTSAADAAYGTARKIIGENRCYSVSRLDITGKDIAAAGITDGKAIGIALKKLLSAVIAGNVDNKKQQLIEYLPKIQCKSADKTGTLQI